MLQKIHTHVRDIADCGTNLDFAFHRFVRILDRRLGSRFPESVYHGEERARAWSSEKHLVPYMVVDRDACFLDVGANKGMWALWMAKRGYEVHAFEPNPLTFDILRRRSRHFPTITPHNCALGEKQGTALLHIHHQSGHDSLVRMYEDYAGLKMRVPVKTLDDYHFSNVGLIKIDTEGYELPILNGAIKTICRNSPRLIIEVHGDYQNQMSMIYDFLLPLDYRAHMLLKSTKQPQLVCDKKTPD